jgi:biotin carboxyl carrier protein
MPFRFRAGGRDHLLVAERDERAGVWRIETEGEVVELAIEPLRPGEVLLRRGATSRVVSVTERDGALEVAVDGDSYSLSRSAPPSLDAAEAEGGGQSEHGRIASPMPAKVVKVLAREGDRVKARQTLVVLESMKIEHLIEAPYAALVDRVLCRPADVVAEGAPLVELEAQ